MLRRNESRNGEYYHIWEVVPRIQATGLVARNI